MEDFSRTLECPGMTFLVCSYNVTAGKLNLGTQ